MASPGKSVYFGDYRSNREQWLMDSLIRECISIRGESMYYCPRTIGKLDTLYTSDDQSSYEQAIMIPIYIEPETATGGFAGQGSGLGDKIGLTIWDRIALSISQTEFADEVGTITGQVRPNEGDLIYFPLNNKCFQIKYVDKFEMFYPLGALYTWKLQCELFDYASEHINTGIPEIDILQTKFDTNVMDWVLLTEDFKAIMDEDSNYLCVENSGIVVLVPGDQSAELEEESQEFIDFSVIDPFSDGFVGRNQLD
jgi:hypothetical protein